MQDLKMVEILPFSTAFFGSFPARFPPFGSAGHDTILSEPGLEVGITGFKERKTAHKEGVKDWYRLDVVPWLSKQRSP